MVISRNNECPQIKIFIDGKKLKQRDQLKYLGTLISNDGCNNTEITSRITQAKKNFQRMKSILTNDHISIQIRRRALECNIEPILMYGCDAKTTSKQVQKKLEATEMRFLQRMLQISWSAKKPNETDLREADRARSLMNKICECQATFFCPCDENRETKTSYDNWNDGGKTQLGKTV